MAVSGIVLGTFVLGPSLNALPETVRRLGPEAFAHPTYLSSKTILLCLGPLQVATLLTACSLSVLKPWGDRNRTPARKSNDVGTSQAAL